MIKIVFLILLIILGATFSTLNRQEISLHYFWGWNIGSFSIVRFYPDFLSGGDDRRFFLWVEEKMGTPVPGSRLRGKSQSLEK